jgi:uncharacterized membrane protein
MFLELLQIKVFFVTEARWWRSFAVRVGGRFDLYPLPAARPLTRRYWLAFGLVTIAVIGFSTYFCSYLIANHDAFQTNAEDLGIMDQAIWSILHGFFPRQTICNSVFDTNCVSYAGVTRFAIHFEPILYPISLLYLIWSNPKMLLIVQVLVVACGAYPAFWLARLRLRSDLAAVGIAVLYLVYPGLLQAVDFDFHAVTLTAALLLFLLYFIYTRQILWTFVFAVLAMACKEEISLVVAGFGIWSAVFQGRWRAGLGLALIGIVWFCLVVLVIMPHASPTGYPLLLSRYAQLGSPLHFLKQTLQHPRQFFDRYIWESHHRAYLLFLLTPVCFIAVFAPWVLVLAVPSLALNLLSSDGLMYSGLFQYSAEIVPVVIFATIEGLVSVFWLVRLVGRKRFFLREKEPESCLVANTVLMRYPARSLYALFCGSLLVAILFSTLATDGTFYGVLPFSQGFQWPSLSAHASEVEGLLDMIPANVSVCAQNKFVPHLSERAYIYLFPYQDDRAEYILLDTTGDTYPLDSLGYAQEVQKVLHSGHYHTLIAKNGYLLLQRVLPVAYSSHRISPRMIGKDKGAAFS